MNCFASPTIIWRKRDMDLQLAGKVALVTGASVGIGRSIALLLAEEGCRVAVLARRKALLDQLADEIAAAGCERRRVVAEDITDLAAASRIAAAVDGHFGRLDILVNNAGASRPMAGLGSEEEWQGSMELNFQAGRRL